MPEDHLSSIWKFSSYLTENTPFIHYKKLSLTVLLGYNSSFFFENCMKHAITLCVQNARFCEVLTEFLNIIWISHFRELNCFSGVSTGVSFARISTYGIWFRYVYNLRSHDAPAVEEFIGDNRTNVFHKSSMTSRDHRSAKGPER
jgi:hypothetical protein